MHIKRKANKNHAFFQIKKKITLKYLKNIVLEGFWRVAFQDAEYGTLLFFFFFAVIHPINQSKYKYNCFFCTIVCNEAPKLQRISKKENLSKITRTLGVKISNTKRIFSKLSFVSSLLHES